MAQQLQAIPLPLDAIQTSRGLADFRNALLAAAFPSERIRAVQQARQRRGQVFSAELFSDPAWDMLLELYALELEQRRISIGALCRAICIPFTTGLRWLDVLAREGLITRRCDPLDARRTFISLSPKALDAMAVYFDSEPAEELYT